MQPMTLLFLKLITSKEKCQISTTGLTEAHLGLQTVNPTISFCLRDFLSWVGVSLFLSLAIIWNDRTEPPYA